MSLVLEALNKAKQQTPGNKAGDSAQLQIMTGGVQAAPSATSRVGVLIGAAVGVVGVMLALAVVVLGMMLKPSPRAAHAEVTMTTPSIAPVAASLAVRAPQEPILEVQPFLDTLIEKSQDDEPATAETAQAEPVMKPSDAPAEPTAPVAALETEKHAALPVIPAPPAAPKDPLKAGMEYVQTLNVSDAPQVKLGAVIWSDTLKVALINGATMQTGDGVNGVKLVEIEPKRVKLEYGDKTFWLRLP